MKNLLLLIPTLIIAFCVMAQPPKGPAKKGMVFGEKTTAANAVTANELSNFLAAKESAEVKVKGKVVEVCKAEGCWIRMQTAAGSMLIKMKDHSFTVPLAINGKTIVAGGTATFKETTVEMLRHYAEDAGKSKAEIEAVKEPKKEIILQAKGIVVL